MSLLSYASLDDVESLHQLINSAYRGDSARMGWTHEADLLDGIRINKDDLENLLTKDNTKIVIYKEEEKIVGCMLLEKVEDFYYLGMLTVSPTLQGKGIGKKLLMKAEEDAVKNNIHRIKMTVISSRNELIDWYTSKGYVDTGVKQPFPNEPLKFGIPKQPLEFIIMEKTL